MLTPIKRCLPSPAYHIYAYQTNILSAKYVIDLARYNLCLFVFYNLDIFSVLTFAAA